jgi:peptidoglycan hydrolase-like protein with peptidoglycan-binding domain
MVTPPTLEAPISQISQTPEPQQQVAPTLPVASPESLRLDKFTETYLQAPAEIDKARNGSIGEYLKLGSQGDDVLWLKNQLNVFLQSQGKQPLDTTSNTFDQKTLEAVKALQAQAGLVQDGVVGFRTMSALDKLASANSSLTESLSQIMLTQEEYNALEERDKKTLAASLSTPTNTVDPSSITQPLGDGTVTFETVAKVLRQAGFSEQDIPIFVAIAMAESSNNPSIVNEIGCVGLFQINEPVHGELLSRLGITDLTDPLQNARAAKAIYDEQGLGAWEVYTKGSYSQYLAEAEAAAASTRP